MYWLICMQGEVLFQFGLFNRKFLLFVRVILKVINYIVIFVLLVYDLLVSMVIIYIFLKVVGFICQVLNDLVQLGYVNFIL